MADNYAADKALEEARIEQTSRYTPEESMSAGRYLATRFSTLKPPMNKAPNPFRLVAMLNRRQWAFFFIGFIAWVCFLDSYICAGLMEDSRGMPLISSPSV
jgi:SHS family lactate transporter-like MFS transporter